jgi:effector-binding domain-containing protein
MIDFDVGDYVVCISTEDGYRLKEKQVYRVYVIEYLGWDEEDIYLDVFNTRSCDYMATRFKKVIPYSRLNETLYPDYVKVTLDKKDYLLPKNVRL